jgi:hypothetical protein
MRTVELQVLSFNELSPAAKQVVLDNYRDIHTRFDDWSEPIQEGFREKAIEAGFEIEDIFFSGFWSQGDGAMFTYCGFSDTLLNNFVDQLDLSDADKVIVKAQAYVSGKGLHRGNYYHEKSCDHHIWLESNNPDWEYGTDLIDTINSTDTFDKYVIKTYEDLCGELYSDLEKYYEELTSDQAVQEYIEESDYEFTKDGSIY